MACFDIPGDLKLTPDRRSIMFTTGPRRVQQRMRAGIHTLLGSYKYNLNARIPWLQWLDKRQRIPIESELRKFFLSFPEVQSVDSLSLTVDRKTRMLFVNYEIQLRSGITITDSTGILQITS